MKAKQYTLECEHPIHLIAKPAKYDIFYCLRCKKERQLKGTTIEYRFVCDTCSYARTYGQARVNCELGATRHSFRFPTHKINVYYGADIKYGIQKVTQPELTEGDFPF